MMRFALILFPLILSLTTGQQILLTAESKLVTASLPPNKPYKLIADEFSKRSSDFFIPQCHSKQHNFTLLQSAQPFLDVKETDFSIGDVIFGGAQSPLLVNNTNNSTFDVYCTYTRYTGTDPIPGGCNMEFNFENDPNIHTWYDGFQLWMQFQYASVNDAKCDKSQNYTRLKYSVYALHFYTESANSDATFTASLSKYILPSNIRGTGTKLLDHTRKVSSKPAMIITSYADQPVLVGIVVTDTTTGKQASYVSKASYGCDVNRYTSNHPCQVQWYFYLLASVLGLIGIFLTFVAHRFFYCEVFISGFLAILFCSFIGLIISQVSPAGLLAGSAGLAVVGGALWLVLWYTAGIATLSAALTAANTGFLISSIIFYSPLVNVSIFSNNWQMWVMYPVPIVIMVLLLLLWSKKVNIVSCAFLGSYCIVSALSVYINASLHHIIVESVRQATVYQYYNAVFSAPFSAKDGGLVALWIILAVVGAIIQFYTERGKPEFPMSPRKRRRGERLSAELEEQARLLNPPGGSTLRPSTTQRDYGTLHA